MNPLTALAWGIGLLAILAALGAPLAWGMTLLVNHDRGTPFPVARLAAATAAFALALALMIWAVGTFALSDDSEHCGTGTHYLETGSGKYHSWICVAS